MSTIATATDNRFQDVLAILKPTVPAREADLVEAIVQGLLRIAPATTASPEDLADAALSIWKQASQVAGLVTGKVPAARPSSFIGEAGREALEQLGDVAKQKRLTRYLDLLPPGLTARLSAEAASRLCNCISAAIGNTEFEPWLRPDDGNAVAVWTVRVGEPVAISDFLPLLENLGLRVIDEETVEIAPSDERPLWIQVFKTRAGSGVRSLTQTEAERIEEAVRRIWDGTVENDGLNRLLLVSSLAAREVVILRCYTRFLRQVGSSFSNAYLAQTLTLYPAVAEHLVDLFRCQFDPAFADDRDGQSAEIERELQAALDEVENLDRDRILRSYLLLIQKTLRTNYYQPGADSRPKPHLSIKLASSELDLLPTPRPLVEIFVYSTSMEGCHLRGGRIARGGLRWSDRLEDFRTEILGLVKAQMVKNAVIVPNGAKGGFVVKRPPQDREQLRAAVVACYRTLIGGLLDLTDNVRDGAIARPRDTVCRDGDDPFLVIAADKGTATFSDIANGIALERGFWLGDAFASGGSVGYDHKAMGITSKGAWEAVKRHFREIGADTQANGFTCVGVGDMSGDVFGNGMLLSRQTKLLAAFDHRQVFLDPTPDPGASWMERKRLFDLPRSSWADYDRSMLSEGGGVYDRSLKSVTVSRQAQEALGLPAATLSPQELIRCILRAEVDLIWFGGIGTYVKASTERHADVGDRANDELRVDAATLRAKIVGEGANLALTQQARVEFALNGGRINTDAIDNSAGVDTSDHEVNVKIGVSLLIDSGNLTAEDRPAFLGSLEYEISELVLRNNYLQNLGLSLEQAAAPRLLDRHVSLMRKLEAVGRLDRTVEFLPDDEAVRKRGAAGLGLTRPEMAVLMAYSKLVLRDELLASDLPEAPELFPELIRYFPTRMAQLAPDVLAGHRLHREIVATTLANELVNRLGTTFIDSTRTRTGRGSASIMRAYLIARDVLDLSSVWRGIDALDGVVPVSVQTRLYSAMQTVVDQAVRWFLLSGLPLQIDVLATEFQPGVRELGHLVTELLPPAERDILRDREAALLADGIPPDLAGRVAILTSLSTGMDIVQIAQATDWNVMDVARCYFEVGLRFGLLMLRRQARAIQASTPWQALAADALVDDAHAQQRDIVSRVLARMRDPAFSREEWFSRRTTRGSLPSLLTEVARTSPPDLAMLVVLGREIKTASA